MGELPILNGVLKYIEEKNIMFSMPGHKGSLGFLFTKEGRKFCENILQCDLTEVDGLDNLHNSEGIIKESGNLLSRFYNSKKSYFLVNGSTSGNLTMIFSCFKEKDKIIVERNCHRSIFNGIIMRKLKPIYIKNKVYKQFNAPLSIDLEHFLSLIKENKDAKGIVITYPNYYGVCPNLEIIIKEAKKYNMKVLIDSAHGAHFGVCESLPKSALELGADMVVMSAHKTLPSLTQTAFLHIGKNTMIDIDKVDFYISAFSSTSPSYLFLCSMDYSRFYIEKYGEKHYNELVDRSNYYREKINLLDSFYILNHNDKKYLNIFYKDVMDIDLTRYVINVKKGLSASNLSRYLRKCGIQCEMTDGNNVILILSPFYNEDVMEKLYKTLCDWDKSYDNKDKNSYNYDINYNYIETNVNMYPYEVLEKEYLWINYKDSLDKISYNNIVPYPPGVPIIMAGEVINKEIIDAICYYKNNGIDVLGLKNDNIQIVK
ncbi:aminotransferase class V-fold PLP-dependent enzyme [Clostridium sporogenes]|uniref:Aminotransferase class V-fold PLP-dependent enzyme n=1 Tax=Clostridium botulinum TaxID=1491 RepID=A0A6M0SZL8_CLOBO|nr:aminotransferase class V-fold PLP-dependent enzyme [Clostridium sporogenes]NFA60583.1 aminotransferase class V-fold PLP-dependent enzyme [Clostridium botulinum]NFI74247.1 aminotransferase class V-fold PLP-dependent enzyme [Clostridium sporogenes]NFL73704.1 aminotransferase class V-fold PLP-dependent enzyme [Clostridium sporogenes]NFM25972.1 aminotransferase class V-fold PLP-dependent enzyme [Clostridium sporogenes]NFP62121.1 aminotransferase class V-fold PLP-dependent enzyme [Clostridium sp